MRLRLNLCDVDFQLEISNWRVPKTEGYDDSWCDVNLYLQSKYINYNPKGELLECAEVLSLVQTLNDFICGNLTNDREIEFIEPDFCLKLFPAKRLYNSPENGWFKEGYMDFDIDAEWVIHFWCDDGSLGANTMSLAFDRSEIEALYTYLKYVIGELTDSSSEIKAMVNTGIFLTN